MKMKKRFLSILLSLALVLGLMPGMQVMADDTTFYPASTYTGFDGLMNNDTLVNIFEAYQYNWYVIAHDSSTVTLLLATSLGSEQFNDSTDKGNNYSTSDIKQYVDGLTGTGKPFAGISSVISSGPTLIDIDTANGLSVTKLKGEDAAYGDWWLSSSGTDPHGAASVYDGNISAMGFQVTSTNGVRPVIKLDLSKVTFNSSRKTFSIGAPVTNYNLWVGGTQVTSANASNIDGSNKARYEADTNTLALNGYSYSGNDFGIEYKGTDELTVVVEGSNNSIGGKGIYSEPSLTITGSGSLSVASTESGAINSAGDLTISGSVNIEANGNAYAGIGCSQSLSLSSTGKINVEGLSFGLFSNSGEISIEKGSVTVEGGSCGIYTPAGMPIIIGENAKLVAIGGDLGAIYYYNDGGNIISSKVKNDIAGAAWTNKEGTEGKQTIEVNTEGQSISNIYKRVQFPMVKEKAKVTTPPKAKSGLKYTGSAQALVTTGTVSGGTMNYALGKDASTEPSEGWSEEIPTGTEAKTYYVWYKAVGDESHTNSDADYVKVTIDKKTEAHTHDIKYAEAKEPTCTEDGYEEHYECTICNEWFADKTLSAPLDKTEVTKKATGHKWDKGVVTEEATYDETGIKTYTCSVCGETKAETIPVKTRRSSSSSDSSDSDSESSGGGSRGKSVSISQKSIDVNGNTVQTQPDSGAPLSDRGGNWGNQEHIWTYTKSDGNLAKGEWLNLEYDGHTYWYYFDDNTIMQTNWFDYNGSRYFLVPEMDGWRGRMATGWHQVDNKWYYFEPTIGANQGILYRGMTTPDGHTVGADGAWDGNGTTPVGAIHTGTTVTMN